MGFALMLAGVVAWMRYSKPIDRPNDAFRSRDALVTSTQKRTLLPVSSLAGMVLGSAAEADSVEVWSPKGLLVKKSIPKPSTSFDVRFGTTYSANIALVARLNGRILAMIPGNEIRQTTGIQLGSADSVAFSTRFVDPNLRPVSVKLSGSVRVGDVAVPIDTKGFLASSKSGDFLVPGLPKKGFVSFRILNTEFAQTYALFDIALRTDSIRTFPRVKVYPANMIYGRVVDHNRQPLARTKVVIRSNIRYFRMPITRTDLNGRFSFSRLPNGVYSVQAVGGDGGSECSFPVSDIHCANGETQALPDITFQTGNFITFVINDTSDNRTQPVLLEISGDDSGRRWFFTRMLSRSKPTKILVPQGIVRFQASQQSRNGIMPLSRNVNVAPSLLDVKPNTNQVVTINIVPRKR